MKTKLSIAMLLTVISLAFIAAGVTGARQSDSGFTVYLPIVRSFCTPKVTAYVSASSPVVRVGEDITLTGAIVNECAQLVGQPGFGVSFEPSGIFSPTMPAVYSNYDIHIGEYRTLTLTLQAVSAGQVTISGGMRYETVNDGTPPGFYWDVVIARPIVVRVLPSP